MANWEITDDFLSVISVMHVNTWGVVVLGSVSITDVTDEFLQL